MVMFRCFGCVCCVSVLSFVCRVLVKVGVVYSISSVVIIIW